MTTRIERGEGGRSTVLHLMDVKQFAQNAAVRINFIGTTQTLGPNGPQSTPYDIKATEVRTDAAVTVPSSFTSHIRPGTPVEILVPAFGHSEQRHWPLTGEDNPPRPPGGDEEVEALHRKVAELEVELKQRAEELENTRGELERTKGELETTKAALTAALAKIEELKKGKGWPPLAKALVATAAVLGLLVGAAGKHAYDGLAPPGPVDEANVSQLQAQIRQLTDEAFAPLERNVAATAATSPKGKAPDAVARPIDPARVHAFYNAGKQERDKAESVYWFKQAVRLCEPDALAELGDAYFLGGGVNRSQRTGFQLMRCATALGSRSAADKLRRLLEGQQVPLGPPSIAPQYGSGQR
jgi:hypothetical protein